MKLLVENFKKYPVRFILTALALVFGLASLILYASTGIIRNFTESYSVATFIFIIVGILASGFLLFTKVHLVDVVPFVAYLIAVLTFLVINANYLVAVARAIDVTSVSASFVITIVLLVLGSASQIAAVSIKK